MGAAKGRREQLKDALRSLELKIEEAKRKRNLLVSRQKRAEAQRTINDTLANIQGTSAFDTFERMADRVTQLEAEAEATAELSTALPEASLDAQFKRSRRAPSMTSSSSSSRGWPCLRGI